MSFPGTGWPTGPLQAAQRAFGWLCCEPQPLTFDCRPYEGLPDGDVVLEQLRELLLAPQTGRATRDAVWRDLVARARGGQAQWTVAVVGMALPALVRAARALSGGRPGQTDLDAELLAGYMGAVHTVDLDRGRICARLVRAGVTAAQRLRDTDAAHVAVEACRFVSRAPSRPWDHPDLLLARAVTGGVISELDARLIAVTRLDRVLLATAAAGLGIAATSAQRRRRRAEHRLVAALAGGDL